MGATGWRAWGKDKRDCRTCRDARKGQAGGGSSGPPPLISLLPAPGENITDQTVTFPSTGMPTASGRIEFDFTPNWTDDGLNHVLFWTLGSGPTDGEGILIWILSAAPTVISVYMGASEIGQSSALSWAADTKYHVTFTWGVGTASIYRDGVEIGTFTPNIITTHGDIVLGSFPGVGDFADGTLANVLVFAS